MEDNNLTINREEENLLSKRSKIPLINQGEILI
jgi:hypothetical protein